MSLAIANTIRDQIKGPLFMMGARQLRAVDKGLQFQIPRSPKNVRHVFIGLEPSDTYRLEFWSIRGTKTAKLSETSGIYADQLADVLERHTGYATHLPYVRELGG